MPKQNKVHQNEIHLYTFSLPDTSVLLSALGCHKYFNATFPVHSLPFLSDIFYGLKWLTLLWGKWLPLSFVSNASFWNIHISDLSKLKETKGETLFWSCICPALFSLPLSFYVWGWDICPFPLSSSPLVSCSAFSVNISKYKIWWVFFPLRTKTGNLFH